MTHGLHLTGRIWEIHPECNQSCQDKCGAEKMYAFLWDVVEYKYKVSYTVNKVHIIVKVSRLDPRYTDSRLCPSIKEGVLPLRMQEHPVIVTGQCSEGFWQLVCSESGALSFCQVHYKHGCKTLGTCLPPCKSTSPVIEGIQMGVAYRNGHSVLLV